MNDSRLTFLQRLRNQPLVWFLGIAVLLFWLDDFLPSEGNEIFVPSIQRERLAGLWQTQTGVEASEEELDSLLANWIDEELMYREAIRLGLDQNDSIVRRRLVQKLGFLLESGADEAPQREELLTYYQDNISSYTLPVRYSFQQLYFSSREQAQRAKQQILTGVDAESLGETSMLNSSYAYRSGLQLSALFGRGFSEQLDGLTPNEWSDPVESGYGIHLIKLLAQHPSEPTPFDVAIAQVAEDYSVQLKNELLANSLDEIRNRYTVIRE